MGILDNDTVIVDAILTKLGRQKLAQGQSLGITQFAFGDTGVDYTLYNPDHPSGSDSYGSAITNLPMLEAVPDNDVFLRFQLYGEGERNVTNFAYITIENSSPTIVKVAGTTTSTQITLTPTLIRNDNAVADQVFSFKVLDVRGLTISNATADNTILDAFSSMSTDPIMGFTPTSLPAYDYPNPVTAVVRSEQSLVLNAQAEQITSQKSVGVEISQDGAASKFVTVTVNVNNTTA